MCNELRTLPVSLETIESKRLKIEAVVMNSSEGETVTDLLITALTPTGKPIVRYELAVSPSKPVGSELAALLNTARSCNVPGDLIISQMNDCVNRDGRLYFTATEPQGCPDVVLPMKRVIPTFEEFARRPETLDTKFKTEALVHGLLVRAVATINPDHRESVIEANSYSTGSHQVLPTHHFKVRCSDDFWSTKRTREEIIAELIKVTWNVMERITADGAAATAEHFHSPEVDERLQAGTPSPLTSDTVHVFPSGARLLLEVGDSFACVGIQAQASDESTSFYWVLKADQGILSQRDPKMISARSAVETLIHGTSQQRLKAIATLDRLKHKQTFSKPGLESVVGFRLAESLSYLNNAIVQVADPRSEMQALDILDGIQQVECTFRDPGHSRRNPHDPHFMRLGFCPDGSLTIELVTPIGNHTETVIPSSYFEARGGCESTVEILVNLFDKQTSHGFLQLRSLIEDLSRYNDGFERDAARLRSLETKLPSPHDGLANHAYVMATELAKVYEVASQASIGEADIFFRNPPQAELIVSNTFGKLPTRLVIEVSKDGAQRIDMFTREAEGVRHAEISFASPLHYKRDADVLHEIFRLLGEGIVEDDIATPTPPPASLWNSPLYKYLKRVEASQAPTENA
jgi:hypothetical protein